MARRGENIYKRKDGRYEGRYKMGRKPDGGIHWGYIYAREYAEVKRRLELKKSQYPGNLVLTSTGTDFATWTNCWLSAIGPYIKTSTYIGYKRTLDTHILPYFGARKLRSISQEDCQAFVDKLSSKLAPSTARGVCRLLKAVLMGAVKEHRIAGTPYVGIREPKLRHSTPRVLTRSEQRQLEKTAKRTGRFEYLLLLYTGLRLGEICALRWRNIDFMEGTLTVEQTMQRVTLQNGEGKTTLLFGSPKSEAGLRTVAMPHFLLQLLQSRFKETGASPDGFVIGRGTQHTDPRTLQHRFSQLARQLNIHGVHVHTLRHTYAARCREHGIGYEVLAELMGHSSPGITLQYYGGCTALQKQKDVQKLQLIS